MSEIRRDPLRGHWTIIAGSRAARPSDFSRPAPASEKRSACPFCPGNERLTPSEVMAVRPSDDPPNEAGWSVRVIPNKYPAVRSDVPLAPLDTGGLFERVPAMGAHELVIVSPEHDRGFSQISTDHWDRVLAVCQHRMYQLWQTPNTQHVALFLNHGPAAGASRSVTIRTGSVGATFHDGGRSSPTTCRASNSASRSSVDAVSTNRPHMAFSIPMGSWEA